MGNVGQYYVFMEYILASYLHAENLLGWAGTVHILQINILLNDALLFNT